jgi:NTP pyrophosphatase (non-canonical NTP hydrolase)
VTFDSYQKKAAETAVYPEAGTGSVGAISYVTLGLTGEAGEIANKVKKILRDRGGEVDLDTLLALRKELGDVQWYVAMLAKELGARLSEVAALNVLNLANRQRRGTLHGDGDDR